MILRPRSATFRYRVGDLTHVYGEGEWLAGSLHEVREFRTLAAAQRYGAELAARGCNALLQVGVMQWMTPDDAERVMSDLSASGVDLDGN